MRPIGLVKRERGKGVINAVVYGSVIPVFQEDTWNEDEDVMTGLIYNLGEKLNQDKESEYVKKSSPRRLREGVLNSSESDKQRRKSMLDTITSKVMGKRSVQSMISWYMTDKKTSGQI